MTEDEMYDIIYGYEESEREFHERNIELENENANLRKRNARLKETCRDSNRKLRITNKDNEQLAVLNKMVHYENAELRQGNAKLRDILYDPRINIMIKKQEKLIAELREFAKTCITVEDCGIDYCPFEKMCSSSTREIYSDECKLYEEMKRLGVSD